MRPLLLRVMNKSNISKKAMLLEAVIYMSIVCCSLWSCTKSAPLPPTDKIVERCFQNTDNFQPLPSLRKEIKIYVDGSGSMKGFVNTQGNTVFSRLIRGLATSSLPKYDISFFKMGTDNLQKLNLGGFWQISSNRSLFDQLSTRLDLTLSSFLGEEEPASAYLVITDGVQASPIGCDYPSFVNPINKWLGEGEHILHIYAFRSEFNGTVFSANTGSNFHYESDTNNPSTFRPFYIYAFIFDKDLEMNLQNIIRNLGIDYHLLNFSDKIMRGRSGLEFKLPDKMVGKDKNRLRIHSRKEEKGKKIIFLHWLGGRKETGEGYLVGTNLFRYKPNLRFAFELVFSYL